MSWDAYLYAGDEVCRCEADLCPHKMLRDWNYTHNCNRMANAVLPDDTLRAGGRAWWAKRGRDDLVARIDSGDMGGTWWECLDEVSGPEGAALLDRIIKGLEADPDRFRAMNPENGWGDYDSFVKVLTDMRNSVPEWPTIWSTSG